MNARKSKQAQKPRQCPRQERGPPLQVKPMLEPTYFELNLQKQMGSWYYE